MSSENKYVIFKQLMGVLGKENFTKNSHFEHPLCEVIFNANSCEGVQCSKCPVFTGDSLNKALGNEEAE